MINKNHNKNWWIINYIKNNLKQMKIYRWAYQPPPIATQNTIIIFDFTRVYKLNYLKKQVQISWFWGDTIWWVHLDLRNSVIFHFLPNPNPLYYTSDLLARGFKIAVWLMASAPGPLACLSHGTRPPIGQLAAHTRPRNCVNLT